MATAPKFGKAVFELAFAGGDVAEQAATELEKHLKRIGRTVTDVGKKMAAVGASITGPLLAATARFAQVGSELVDTSAKIGVSVEQLSTLKFAAEQSGASMGDLQTAFRGMARVLDDAATGSTTAVESLAKLGLTIDDLRGTSADEQFKLLADRIGAIEDPTARAALAMEVFGRSGTALIPLLSGGRKAIEDLQKQAEEMGLQISTQDAAAAETLGDAWDALKATFDAVAIQIGAALAPTMTSLTNTLQQTAAGVTGFIRENRSLVVAAAAVGAALTGIGTTLIVVGKAIGATVASIKTLIGVFSLVAAHPVGAALTALGLVLATVAANYRGASTAAREFLAVIQQQAQASEMARQEDQARLARLEELNQKQSLSNTEMAEAASLAAQLNGAYSGLGINVNAATGAIEGLATATERLVMAQREQLTIDLEKQLAALKEARTEAHSELTQSPFIAGPFTGAKRLGKEGKATLDQFTAQIDAIQARLEGLKAPLGGPRAATQPATPAAAKTEQPVATPTGPPMMNIGGVMIPDRYAIAAAEVQRRAEEQARRHNEALARQVALQQQAAQVDMERKEAVDALGFAQGDTIRQSQLAARAAFDKLPDAEAARRSIEEAMQGQAGIEAETLQLEVQRPQAIFDTRLSRQQFGRGDEPLSVVKDALQESQRTQEKQLAIDAQILKTLQEIAAKQYGLAVG